MMNEAQFIKQIIQLAKHTGWRTFHVRPGRTKRGWATNVQGDGAGFPDLLLVHEKRRLLVAAELKVGPNKPTPAQTAWLNAFLAIGVDARVWYPRDWPAIERLLMG